MKQQKFKQKKAKFSPTNSKPMSVDVVLQKELIGTHKAPNFTRHAIIHTKHGKL